eukprot:2932000-Amphidinium_carterae.1
MPSDWTGKCCQSGHAERSVNERERHAFPKLPRRQDSLPTVVGHSLAQKFLYSLCCVTLNNMCRCSSLFKQSSSLGGVYFVTRCWLVCLVAESASDVNLAWFHDSLAASATMSSKFVAYSINSCKMQIEDDNSNEYKRDTQPVRMA